MNYPLYAKAFSGERSCAHEAYVKSAIFEVVSYSEEKMDCSIMLGIGIQFALAYLQIKLN